MRESIIIQKFQQIEKALSTIAYHMQLGFSGNALMEEAIKSLLIKKGLITETELSEAVQEQIKKVQEAETKKADEEKKKLVTPSAEQTAEVEKSKRADESSK